MNATQFEAILRDVFDDPDAMEEHGMNIAKVESFEEAGVLTGDRGLIVKTENDNKFEITIVRSG